MSVYNRLVDKHMELHVVIIWSLFINQIIINLCTILHTFIVPGKVFSSSAKVFIYIVVAIILAVVISLFRNQLCVKKYMAKVLRKTPNKYAIDDAIDYTKRTTMFLYLKNSNLGYAGIFRLKDEVDSDFYITLISYIVFDKSTKETLCDNSDTKSSVIINSRDIERIELFYENDSKVWEWLNEGMSTEKKCL